MKKATALLAALALAIPAGANSAVKFDENRIALSFGVISDIHIDSPHNEVSAKFSSALMQLRDAAAKGDPDGIDGILVAGDLTNDPYRDKEKYCQVDWFRDLYLSVFPDPVKVPMVYTQGNHDTFREWTDNAIAEGKNISERLGKAFFATDIDDLAREKWFCRHCVVKECHILSITPTGRDPVTYDPEAIAWLDGQLAEITSREPDRYVLVLTHAMIYNTVYGSLLGNYWYTAQLTPVLEKYPQAVTFGGHLHFPLNDPRSIWQGSFTAMGTASVRYMAIEAGHYERMSGATVMKDRNEFSQGLLVQMDEEGNMRVTRMDFFHCAPIGKPWTLDHPDAKGGHLKAYRHDSRRKANRAPSLSTLEIKVGEMLKDVVWPVNALFTSGADDEFVHHYILRLSTDGEEVVEKRILSDFYRHPQAADMKREWDEPLGNLPKGNYTLTLTAVDSWGAESRPLVRKFTL